MTKVSVGRLLCVGIRGAFPGDDQLENDLEVCAQAGVGGVILFDVDVPTMHRHQQAGLPLDQAIARSPRNIIDPEQTKELIAHIRTRLGRDVWVGIDQEGGRVARLSSRRGFEDFPSAKEFAALDEAGQAAAAARQAVLLRLMGIDLNFAPCVDLALEPTNEIIAGSERAFGSDPQRVIAAAGMVLEAHAVAGVAACLKHFPGHGSSRGDTHQGAVDVTETWQREIELAPYEDLSDRPGLAVMVAHVMHRGLDPDRPASLSPAVINELLRGEIGFDGVVVTDSIDMRAVADRWTPAEAAVAAVNAGADLVVDGFNLAERDEHPAAELAGALQTALKEGRITGGQGRIKKSCRRIDLLRSQIQ